MGPGTSNKGKSWHNACVDDVPGQLGRRPVQTGTDCLNNRCDRLTHGPRDLLSVTTTDFGRPSTRSRPFTSIRRGSPLGESAEASETLISSAWRPPTRRL